MTRKLCTGNYAAGHTLAAAGEAMLARGTHGSLGVFIGFCLPTLAGLAMSFVMLFAINLVQGWGQRRMGIGATR